MLEKEILKNICHQKARITVAQQQSNLCILMN